GLFLMADLATRVQRVSARTGDASDADAEVARQQEEFVTGPVTWSRVDAAGSPGPKCAQRRAALAREGGRGYKAWLGDQNRGAVQAPATQIGKRFIGASEWI